MNTNSNGRGALYMAVGMAAFTCNDALVKSVTHAMNTGQILFLRGLMTSVLVLFIARWMGALGSWRIVLEPAVALRLVSEVFASLAYVSALGAMPLANTSAILQSLPLAVTLGAALFLGEQVEVPLARGAVGFGDPLPGAAAEDRQPAIGRQFPVVSLAVAEDETLALR